MDKAEIRKLALAQRIAMTPDEYRDRSERVVEHLIKYFLDKPGTILGFEPILSKNEPDIQPFYAHLDLIGRSYEIAGNSKFQPYPVGQWDYILVPTLSYDSSLNRIGYGGGWYDRFLVRHSDSIKIGVSYGFNKAISGIESEKSDIPIDLIITERILDSQTH